MKGRKQENELTKQLLEGVDEQRLRQGDEQEVSKFRHNIGSIVGRILRLAPRDRRKRIETLKAGMFELMAQIPVVTPVVTAMFQVVTGEDLSSKMDTLSVKMDAVREELGAKMDTMLDLQRQTLDLQRQTLDLQHQTLDLQRQTLDLQRQTLDLQHQTLDLQRQTLDLQHQNLRLSKRVIAILDERLPPQRNQRRMHH